MDRVAAAGIELKDAVEEWQMKRHVPEPRLTTGFLEGTHPVVDIYELKVRTLVLALCHQALSATALI